MSLEVGQAVVSIIPSARGFGKSLNTQVNKETTKVGSQAGENAGKRFQAGLLSRVKGTGKSVSASLDQGTRGVGKRAGEKAGSDFAGGLKSKIKGIAAPLAGIFAVGASVDFLRGAIDNASDLNETVNKTNVIFGKNSKTIQDWSKNAARNIGLSRQAALDAVSGYGDLFTQLGFTGDQATKMSKKAVQLSADLGSFSNLDTADVSDRITAAFRGEYDGLQKVIPNINAARVEHEALTATGKKSAKQLTAQEKATAVLAIVQKDGKRAAGDFARTSNGLANSQKIAAARVSDLRANIGKGLLPIVTKLTQFFGNRVVPAISGFVTGMRDGTGAGGKFADIFKFIGNEIKKTGPFFRGVADNVKKFVKQFRDGSGAGGDFRDKIVELYNGIKPAIDYIKNTVVPNVQDFVGGMKDGSGAGGDFVDAIKDIGKKVKGAFGYIVDNKEVFGTFAGTILAIAAAVKIWTTITTIAAGVQAAFAAILAVNPVFLLVGAIAALAAGLVFAYKKSSKFRAVVDASWKVIKKVISVAWHGVIKPVFKALVFFLKNILAPALGFLLRVVRRIFKVIGVVIVGVWRGVIRPIFLVIRGFIRGVLAPVFHFLLDKIIRPVFTGVGKAISSTWHHVIKPVFSALKTGVKSVKDTFKSVVDRIGTVWKTLQGLAAKPVRFVVNTVAAGLVRAINSIPYVKNVKVPHVAFKDGGVLPGYTPGRDVHHFASPTAGNLSLSGGEGILIPQATKALGGAAGIERINARARKGQKFARGGVYWPTVGRRVSTYPGHDGIDINQPPGPDSGAPIYAYRSGRVTYAGAGHGYGNAVFEAVPGHGTVVYGHMSRIATHSGAGVSGGQVIGYVGSTGNSTGPHLHFGHPGGTSGQARALLAGAGASSGSLAGASGSGELGGHYVKRRRFPTFVNPFTALKKKVAGYRNKLEGMGEFGQELSGLPGKLVGSAAGKLKGKVSHALHAVRNQFVKGAKGLGSLVDGAFSGHGGHLSPSAARSATARLMPKSWSKSALNSLWTKESGFRWNADNPSSSAYGIPQALPGSKMGPGWHDDALTQIRWGLRYIAQRYGNSSNAWAHSQQHNWYDQGGIANGKGYLAKNTLSPERVLSPRQTVAFERLADNGFGSNGTTHFVIDNWDKGTGHMSRIADSRIGSAQEKTATLARTSR